MKLNSREKKLLIILIFVGAIFLYYKFILMDIKVKTSDKKNEEVNIEREYNEINSKLKDIDILEDDVNSLKSLACENTEEFYGENEQEKIILDLDKIMKSSEVKGALKFKEAQIKILNGDKKVENIKGNDNEKQDENVSYNNSLKREDITLNKNALKYKALSNEDPKNLNIENKELEKNQKDKFTYAVIENELNIEFNASYDNYYKLVENLEKNSKIMGIKNAKLEYLNDGNVKGSLTVTIYSIPKI